MIFVEQNKAYLDLTCSEIYNNFQGGRNLMVPSTFVGEIVGRV
jgi:hypothetical protein